jgi:FtsZ-interacting cell division protein YlmF
MSTKESTSNAIRAPAFKSLTGSEDIGIMSLDDIFGSGTMDVSNIKNEDEYDSEEDAEVYEENTTDRKRARGGTRNMTEEQKVERRERNREHAKRSRVRKKFLLESLQQSVQTLQEENDKLKIAIREHIPQEADELLQKCAGDGPSVVASDPDDATKILDDPDYGLVKALQTAQQNFVISDPSLPDNPIVYASAGFFKFNWI